MTPKEYKQMMDYLTRSGVRKQIKFASDIARPDPKPEIKEIEAINEFVRRNPRADGGRIGFRLGEKVQLTREKIESMAAKEDGMRAADILKELKLNINNNDAVWHDIEQLGGTKGGCPFVEKNKKSKRIKY